MTVLANPHGPLDHTVAAIRPITLRDLLTSTFGTGMVPAEPGTVPISDARVERTGCREPRSGALSAGVIALYSTRRALCLPTSKCARVGRSVKPVQSRACATGPRQNA